MTPTIPFASLRRWARSPVTIAARADASATLRSSLTPSSSRPPRSSSRPDDELAVVGGDRVQPDDLLGEPVGTERLPLRLERPLGVRELLPQAREGVQKHLEPRARLVPQPRDGAEAAREVAGVSTGLAKALFESGSRHFERLRPRPSLLAQAVHLAQGRVREQRRLGRQRPRLALRLAPPLHRGTRDGEALLQRVSLGDHGAEIREVGGTARLVPCPRAVREGGGRLRGFAPLLRQGVALGLQGLDPPPEARDLGLDRDLGPVVASGIRARAVESASARTTEASPPPVSAIRASSTVSDASRRSASRTFCAT